MEEKCCLIDALKIIGERLGEYHAYYAEVAATSPYGSWLCLELQGSVIGSSIVYVLPTDPTVGVVYYIALSKGFESKGLGKVLLASSEEILEMRGCKAFIASTTLDNIKSISLFKSMGYAAITIDEIYDAMDHRDVDLLLRALCSYEDDVVFIKGMDLDAIIDVIEKSSKRVAKLWRKICYEPWRRLSIR